MTYPEWLAHHFERCWPWLEEALKAFPVHTHDKVHVWEAVTAGGCHLWQNETAAVVTEITVYPTGVRALNAWLAGGDLEGVHDLDKQIDDFARAQGIQWRTILGRDGWLRRLDGYRKVGTMMVKELA